MDLVSTNKIVNNLSALTSQERKQGLKLILKIINNILSNPNDLSSANTKTRKHVKYYSLNKRAVFKKLSGSQTIWFDLLIAAGFDISENDEKLVFDSSKWAQLQLVNNLLLSQNWDITNNEQKIDTQPKKKTRGRILCICGNTLESAVASSIYEGRGVNCDICDRTGKQTDIFWHCEAGKMSVHTGGYDICFDCSQKKCIGHIISCKHANRLLTNLSQYTSTLQNKVENNMDNQNLVKIVDDYLHLIAKHDNNNDFELIFNELTFCDVNQCKIYARHNRDRCVTAENQDIDAVYTDIMDKIHCYLLHCYDSGYRLTSQDRMKIDNMDSKNSDENPMDNILVNQKITKMNQLLCSKRASTYERVTTKFNTIFTAKDESKYNEYRIGYRFKYGFNGEDEDLRRHLATESIPIQKKYSSLKQELISNKIFVIPMKQFNIEYRKASIKFNSLYCKQHFRPLWPDKYITIDCVLSLMIHCGFDNLQFVFGKTYRENNGKNHNEFYWFARNLKIAVQQFGKKVSRTCSLYHGINQPLVFSQYIGDVWNFGARIYCPLSTTSSKAIGIRFAGANGLLIQFGGDNWLSAKGFLCKWLSEFPAEEECLFVQMQSALKLYNIIDVKLGIEHVDIFKALNNMNKVIHFEDRDEEEYDTDYDSQLMMSLMKKIITDQLSSKIKSYEAFESLRGYGREICKAYFQNKNYIQFDYFKCKQQYPFVIHLLFHTDYNWINSVLINILFPKMQYLIVDNINLSAIVCDDIVNGKYPIYIHIKAIKNSDLSIKDAVDKYVMLFKKIGYFVRANLYENKLRLEKIDAYEFAQDLIHCMGEKYFQDDEITKLVDKLICVELSGSINNNDHQQQLFHKYCTKKHEIRIDWNEIVLNSRYLGLFRQFYFLDHQWINLQTLSRLYPNLETIYISHIRLNESIFEKILNYLKTTPKCRVNFWIDLGNGSTEAYQNRKEQPDELEVMNLCKDLTGYDEDDDIFENDWKSFEMLYQIRDNNLSCENSYHLDSLIISYAVLKYQKQLNALGYNIKKYSRISDHFEIRYEGECAGKLKKLVRTIIHSTVD
eukprot:505283_1